MENQAELKGFARIGQLIFVGKMNISENDFDVSQQMTFQVFNEGIFDPHRIIGMNRS